MYVDDAEIRDVIAGHQERNGRVTAILEDLQQRCRYLPEQALRIVAGELGLPLTQLYGVATFFAAFSLEPQGQHLVSVCHGTACHVKGAGRVSESLERELQVAIGKTTGDGQFTLKSVRCLGCCSLAPVVSIDGRAYGRMKPDTVEAVLSDWRGGDRR
ncbi:MAG: NAD(P)H-dependent oxidoreductase subunit E [Thermacetogeniaceae bacterium]|jgi:NADH:ubiquinone oxidoreductase subunit E